MKSSFYLFFEEVYYLTNHSKVREYMNDAMLVMERAKSIENRIYIRGVFEESLGMIFSVPFSLKGSSKCTNHVNVHKLYAVEYINTVCPLDYSF